MTLFFALLGCAVIGFMAGAMIAGVAGSDRANRAPISNEFINIMISEEKHQWIDGMQIKYTEYIGAKADGSIWRRDGYGEWHEL